MQFKVILIIAIVIVFLAGLGAVVYQITKSTESYKGGVFHTFEPHQTFFGCASYRVTQDKPIVNRTK